MYLCIRTEKLSYVDIIAFLSENLNIVLPNRETGYDRTDILLKYPSISGKATIIEIKAARSYSDMENKCSEALRQIEEQRYDEALRQEEYQDIMKYGVSFYQKECMIKLAK